MTVGERRSRSRARGRFIIWLALNAAVWGSVVVTGFDVTIIIGARLPVTVIWRNFPPDWDYIASAEALLDTIKMSVIGSASLRALAPVAGCPQPTQ